MDINKMELDFYSQNILLSSSKFSEEKNYWLDKLNGGFNWAGIPVDCPEYTPSDYKKEFIRDTLPVNISQEILHMANQSTFGLYIFLLAGTAGLLCRYSSTNAYSYSPGEETDMVVGMPVFHQTANWTGNSHISALRITINGSTHFKDLLLQLKDTVGEAKKFNNIPFTKIAQLLNLPPAEGDSPLFKTIVLLENIHVKEIVDNTHTDMVFSFRLQEDQIHLQLEYNSGLFSYPKIKQLFHHLVNIFKVMTANPMGRFCEIDMLTQEEKRRLLEEFNGIEAGYPGDKCIYELFEEQVEKSPDYNIVVGPSVEKNHRLPIQITYRELNHRSNRIAGTLRSKGIKERTVAGIMVKPCVGMVLSIFGVLKAGCVFLPIEPGSPVERVKYVLSDSNADILLSHSHLSGIFKSEVEVINIEESNIYSGKSENKKNAIGPGDPVYVIYTSGTTGKPKGVLIRNKNLVNYVNWFSQAIGLTAKDKTILTSSFAFDALYTLFFSSLVIGCQLHVVARETFLSAELLLNYLRDNEISYIKNTPSLFNLVVNSQWFSKEMLRGLRFAMLGGEEINIKDVEKAHHLCPHLRVMNHYGPTETTIGSITQFIDFENFGKYKETPTIGKPLSNTQAYILDKGFNMVPIGVVGGLFIGGAGVGMGYLNKPELTCERFIRGLLGRQDGLYCTGDLARWRPEGNIEFLGRADDQVKIRGYRIELGEIDSRLLKYPGIKDVVVRVREETVGDKYLCAYIVCDEGLSVPELKLREWLSQGLPAYMIPSYFVQLERLPLTPHGKIDRRALPKPEVKIAAGSVGPRSELEEKLVELWSESLGIDRELISIDSNFFQLGGQSLKAMILTSKIHKELNIELQVIEFFKMPTIRDLSDYISGMEEKSYKSIAPVEKREYYILSYSQKRLYILQQMDSDITVYNMPSILPLPKDLAVENLEAVFKKLIKRHESLRTSFHMIGDEPVQRIHAEVDFEISYYNLGDSACPPLWSTFIRPFDLSQAPLLRVGFVKTGEEKQYLLIDMHHIITDGISQEVLKKDFMSFYNGEELPSLRIQYKDFAQWQNSEEEKARVGDQETYWINKFGGEIPALNLPIDYPRPMVQSFEGSNIDFEITPQDVQLLTEYAREEGVTLYMALLAVTNILLSKLSSQEDIVIGTPVAGRRHADLEKIIGMFINTLAIRNYPTGEKVFNEFLKELGESALRSFENQEYPFEELIESVGVNRNAGRNPLFDVLFVLQNFNVSSGEEFKDGAVDLSVHVPEKYDQVIQTAKFDLTIIAVEKKPGLFLSFHYCTKLFKEETIEQFILYFKKVVSLILEEPGIKIGDIEIISEEEKKRILYDFNDTKVGYPQDKTIHKLFEEQVERTPDHIAILSHGRTLTKTGNNIPNNISMTFTYRQLNEEANHLAGALREKGVAHDSIVGIMIERSQEVIIGILGILKAGGAYLPIDLEYPKERIAYMLKDSAAKIMIGRAEKQNSGRAEFVFSCFSLASSLPHFFASDSSSMAYVIYTSGSTGKPKGVMVEHSSAVNLLYAMHDKYPFIFADTYLLKTAYIFDVSVTELFGWYMGGGKLAILEKDGEKDPQIILDWIERYQISHINFVPSMFNAFTIQLNSKNINRLSSLKYIFLAGEALLPEFVKKFHSLNKLIRLENIYGPTENSVYSSHYSLSAWSGSGSIPIGKPMPNIRLYILDKYNRLQPPGVVGELSIVGIGLARGYLNRPELTADKFIDFRHSSFIIHHSLLYRTGDLCRWLPDGNIEFLGRIDHQVKIRGFRVELGEIENRLSNIGGIKEAVVLSRAEVRGDKYLCAYYVSEREYRMPELCELLSKKLPDYMIPSYFVRIDKIPLTPNGKVDRNALPEPGLKTVASYVAPRDEIETRLVGLWSGILGRDALHASQLQQSVGIDDNFFQLGGHSLKAAVMVSKIQREFGVRVPLVEVFKNPTVRNLGVFIFKENTNIGKTISLPDDNRLVLLKKGLNENKDRHLFFIHDGTGEVDGYIKFCETLREDFNCWGIRADRLENLAPQNISIVELAETYIETMKKIQPHGPYYITGWSLGGTIVFEMAEQLERTDEEIAFLALVDSPSPHKNLWQEATEFNLESELNFVQEHVAEFEMEEKLKNVPELSLFWSSIVDYLETNRYDVEMIKNVIGDYGFPVLPNYDRLGTKESIYYLIVGRTLSNARARYIPGSKLNTQVHYFKASQSKKIKQGHWKKYCRKAIKYYTISGDHFSIFTMPDVVEFTQIFGKALHSAEESTKIVKKRKAGQVEKLNI